MLVLARYPSQAVVITNVGRIVVDDVVDKHGRHIKGARVKLAFDMPYEVNIVREEVLTRQQEADRE